MSIREIKMYRIFSKHYGDKDAEEIVTCLKGILRDEIIYKERLVKVLIQNNWAEEDSRKFVDLIKQI